MLENVALWFPLPKQTIVVNLNVCISTLYEGFDKICQNSFNAHFFFSLTIVDVFFLFINKLRQD